MTGERIWVLVIDHRHGMDLWLFRTQEQAECNLVSYCREWWDVELNEEMPTDNAQLVREYFDGVEDESYTIREERVIEETDCVAGPKEEK